MPVRFTPTIGLAAPPSASYPKLPSSSRYFERKDWQFSAHVFPAAYPRSRIGASVSEREPKRYSLQSTKLSQEQVQSAYDAMEKGQREAGYGSESSPTGEPLWIAVNRYAPVKKSNRKGLTLLLAHANGMHKETWEPTITRILEKLDPALYIEEIWSIDLVNQGDSSVLNVDHLGKTFDWIDVGRDIANFILSYLPPSNSESIPERLPSQPVGKSLLGLKADSKSVSNFRDRSIICIGHSIGGASMLTACSFLPQGLISGLILIDPTICSAERIGTENIWGLTKGALVRKEAWKSREEALQGWKKNKNFFGKWHPNVLKLYAKCALRDTKEGLVALKMEREQEALTFLDPDVQGSKNAYKKIANLPSSLRVYILLADPKESVVFGRGVNPDQLLKDFGHTRDPALKTLNGVGHLIAQERPDLLGDEIAEKLKDWFGAKAKL